MQGILFYPPILFTGNPVDFHHFPNFDPSYGKPGDTLTWFPPSQLRVSDPDKQYPPLYYSPKENVCQHCPDFEHFDNECNNAGDCWRGFCACDNGFTGFKCQDARKLINYKQELLRITEIFSMIN